MMAQRHEEKYIIDYRQYAILKARAEKVLTPDKNGQNGSYTITSLYFDDPLNTALLEKQDGLARHTKFRLRTYNFSDKVIRLERKVKEGIITEKETLSVDRQSLDALATLSDDLAVELRAKGMRPAITVRYRRDAYLYPGTDIRLTFDTDLRVLPPDMQTLFDSGYGGIPVLESNQVIMEVKYGTHLPSFLRTLTAVPSQQLSVSKYALCREKFQ